MARINAQTIKDITDKKLRSSEPDVAASWRAAILLQAFNNPAKHGSELARYYPTAVVATIEGYFRARLAELIDHGDPFRSNAVKAYPDVKLDVELAKAMVTGAISLGEIITHPISLSHFDSLVSAVTNITGQKDWLEIVAQLRKVSLDSQSPGPIAMTDAKLTWSLLRKVFTTRHILCHELASEFLPKEEETRALLIHSQEFLNASALWFEGLQYPDRRESSEKRKKASEARLRKAERDLETVLNARPEIFADRNTTVLPSETVSKLQKQVRELVRFMDEVLGNDETQANDDWEAYQRTDAKGLFLHHLSEGLQHWLFAYEFSVMEREMSDKYNLASPSPE